MTMKPPPSLLSLCMKKVTSVITTTRGGADDGEEDLSSDVWELPSDLFNDLVTRLPPLALHNLQKHQPVDYAFSCEHEVGDDDDDDIVNCGRKRKRCDVFDFDMMWKRLFSLRWPALAEQIITDDDYDWQQKYWEAHVQCCLNEATEIAMVQLFSGRFAEIQISDASLRYIGFDRHECHLNLDHSRLSYHCLQFGYHTRSLNLPSLLCNPEICQLLKNCKLQSLEVRWIRTKEHVHGLCKLLMQNKETLTSLEFMHCNMSTSFVNALCGSLRRKSVEIHGIQHFSVHSSKFEKNLVSLPSELTTFISSGRSLCLLDFSDNNLNRNFATMIFSTLVNASTSISCLDFSSNDISGWLSKFRCEPSNRCRTSLEKSEFFQSLKWLNLRGNNLRKDDAENLSIVLCSLPNLNFLDLSNNSLGDDGIRCLIPYLTESSQRSFKLTELRLSSCQISHDGAIILLDVLSTLERAPTSLSLADNDLGSDVAAALGTFLGTSIRMLNIEGIGLGSSGFKKLHEGMAEKLKLEKINISQNRGRIETAMFLRTLLSRAPELTTVQADFNLMPVESLNIICSQLRVDKGRLELLDLRGHDWDYQQAYVASLREEFQHDGKPILILPSPSSSSTSFVPYDDEP
ncbi:hypothetical protein ACFE04_029962 [Oxalis oulophora]